MPAVAQRAALAAAGVAAAASLAGCTGQTAAQAPPTPLAGPSPSLPPSLPTSLPAGATGSAGGPYIPLPCPSATPASPGPAWPASLPADLPHPVDATIDSSIVNPGPAGARIDVTQFRIPESLVTSVRTVLGNLRTAGYTVGRGDGEVAEADVPFAGSTLRGTIRLVGVGPCETVWIVATARGGSGNSYLLPRHTGPGASASALPFAPATP